MRKLLSIILTICLFSVFLTGCAQQTLTDVMGEPEIRPIKSCILSSEVETSSGGAFILGVATYHSNSETCVDYYVYIKGNEGYRLQKINFNNIEIVETDEIEPSIKGYFSNEGKIYQSVYDIESYDGLTSSYSLYKTCLNYVLYVPTGTVKTEFDVDVNEALN